MSSIFERFCYNDVEQPCRPFFNCTPCHVTLADPNCDRIQFIEPFHCHSTDLEELTLIPKLQIKTESEITNCTKLRSDCQAEFEDCLEPFFACINNCTAELSLETLSKYDGYEGIIYTKGYEDLQFSIFRKNCTPKEL